MSLPTVQIPDWSDLLPIAAMVVLVYLLLHYLRPYFSMRANQFRRARIRWAYEAMIGRQMSVRRKNTAIGERLAAEAVKMMDDGVITRKDKREIIRKIEIMLQLDPGTIGPRPSVQEIKRRVRGRISPMAAAKAEANASGNVVPIATARGIRLNLGNIMSKR